MIGQVPCYGAITTIVFVEHGKPHKYFSFSIHQNIKKSPQKPNSKDFVFGLSNGIKSVAFFVLAREIIVSEPFNRPESQILKGYASRSSLRFLTTKPVLTAKSSAPNPIVSLLSPVLGNCLADLAPSEATVAGVATTDLVAL